MDFKYVPSTCPYCGNGCGVNLVVADGRFVGISPWHRNPVNEGKVCIRGNKSYEFVNSPARLTTPLIKKGDKLEEASWEDAYKEIANAFKSVKGDAIGVVASARNSNEDSFVLKNFAANVLKTANIDYCGRRCNADAVKGLADAFGNGATTNSLADLSQAKAILVVGSNPLEENPLAGRQIILAKQNGAKIIVADARKTATARLADLHIACNPGTGVAIVNGIITEIVKAGKENKDYIAKHTKDFEKAKAAAASCTPDAVAKAAGISAADVTKAAEIFAAAQPAAVVTSAGAGSGDLIRAVANLQLVTGNVGKAGAGVNLLRGKSNAQGAADVGAVPGEGGLTVPAMIEAAAAGKIKALYVVGENIAIASAGANVAEALGKLDILVVQDMFLTETAARANVVLPSASFAERDGTVTNAERRVQRVRKAIEPVGSAKADWEITSGIAKAMGHEKDFAFKDAEAVFNEIAKAVPSYAGITYAALEKPEAIQWPAAGGKFGTAVLYADKFATKDGKAAFAAVEYKAPEAAGAEYPLAVATVWPMGTLSLNSASITREWPEPTVQINHDDAKALGVLDGSRVKVTCKAGVVEITAAVTKNIKKGVVAMTVPAGIMTVKIEKTAGGN
ncbi:molybdopterin oxidoreductase [Methanoregula boonei 6A8]|jgi:formate dehydrogenase major subunit|uniref:Molybdopterin oxidoreductase n=1 Tax=Methanoregula boonei (strain DSM 21154 / JCM 14090 / 6A8) TaxID=456442 RepID=A7I6T0_METB6|nr:molybdopterin-dependent oxidoreductase [Methanoregula boonei]ABS55441.1 molybdopterin oxidoreductase [Methanoregula boonei 6A8]